jgi:ketosteroid isomerase-like protein
VSAEAVAVVEEFNAGIAAGELRWDLIDPEIYVIDHDIPDADSYRGHAGVAKWLEEDWGSAWESYKVEPEQIVDAGDVVVSIFTISARGKGSGVETRRRNATVGTVENGLVTRIEYYTTEEEARTAAGLAAARER